MEKLNFNYKIHNTCCFTGHRFINKKIDENTEIIIKTKLKNEIIKLISKNFNNFISGGAIGVDTFGTEIVIELKKYHKITYELVIPCPNQSSNWSENNKIRYKKILENANKVVTISDKYTKKCMLLRNRYMVENSSLVLGVYDGRTIGGTKYTLDYAKSIGRDVILIDF